MEFVLVTFGIVFCFGVVIFFHEFGHFIVAKKMGVKIEQFCFGFGQEIFGFKYGETRYSLNWIPLGGYVKMAGETPEEYSGPVLEGKSDKKDGARDDHSRDFLALRWYRRIPIVVAGPFMNYVLATIIFFGMFLFWGLQIPTNKPVVGEVIKGLPAELAGIVSGDQITAVNGEPVSDFQTLAEKIHARPGMETKLQIQRGPKVLTLRIIPQKVEEQGGQGFIGITPAMERKKLDFMGSLGRAVKQCYAISALSLLQLGTQIWKREKVDVAGPLGIGQVIVKAVKAGWEDFFYLVGLISVAIGLFNLFPVPLLDGGHLAYYVIEGIRGKPLSAKTVSRANFVGLVLIMSLLVFATSNDVKRIWPGKDKPVPVKAP